jgi:predicted transcriptional regulator
MQSVPRKRRQIEIVRDILYTARAGARKTQILRLANLNTPVLEKYLSTLQRIGLMDYDKHRNVYGITPKGKGYLERFQEYKKYNEMYNTSLAKLRSLLRGSIDQIGEPFDRN